MTDDARKLGYAGSAVIDGIQVLVTQASLNESVTVPYANMVDMPSKTYSRSRVIQSDGVKVSSGNFGFDVTSEAMVLFASERLFQRRKRFQVGYHDGEDGWQLADCFITSLSVTGAAGGLITATIQVTSDAHITQNDSMTRNFIRDQVPYGYWYSGAVDVRDWTLAISQDVVPVYTNVNSVWPTYLRVGMWNLNLQVSTYDQLREHDEISIAGKTFTLTGHSGEKGYNFGGQTELGSYAHSFEAAAEMAFGSGGSASNILTIS